MKSAREQVGQRLKREREARNWSQHTLAQKIGVSALNITRWEHDTTYPQGYYREKLCEVFEKSPEELFGAAEQRSIWHVPHLRNLHFTGHEDTLAQIDEMFASRKMVALTQPAAMRNIHGVGKTLIAVEYAYRSLDAYPAILFVTATTRDLLAIECATLAPLLGVLRSAGEKQKAAIDAVKQWLSRTDDWLLIVDDLNESELVQDFLPDRLRGHVLLTTRFANPRKPIKSIEVGKMTREEGALLLLRRAKIIPTHGTLDLASEKSRADAEAIYEAVDGLPLALDQAGAYIEEHECSPADYLMLFQTRRGTLLQRHSIFSGSERPSLSTPDQKP
ncbi:MAG TPA: helix-turn-helix transcriptional regulator [Ktedonobacteraceae bacterium]|nr:helix-turn-helix transcriptional regulator [Ktedonobacteraceae bacterium]